MDIKLIASQFVRSFREYKKKKRLRKSYESDYLFINTLPFVNRNDKLLLIRLDDIGDYLLFRNFLPVYASSMQITLLGNIAWKSLFEEYDNNMEVIWVDKTKWDNEEYRKELYKQIRGYGFKQVVSPVFNRNFYGADLFAYATGASVSFAWSIEHSKYDNWDLVYRNFYTNTYKSNKSINFEFERNKEFAQWLFPEAIFPNYPEIRISKTKEQKILFFPGAATASRRWPTSKFARLAEKLKTVYPYFQIIIAGSERDKKLAKEIQSDLVFNITDATGATNLPDLCELIAESKLVVTNDTSALHIAASVKTPAVVMSSAFHYWQFCKYPNYENIVVEVALPEKERKKLKINPNYVKVSYYSGEIKKVKVKRVLRLCLKILSKDRS